MNVKRKRHNVSFVIKSILDQDAYVQLVVDLVKHFRQCLPDNVQLSVTAKVITECLQPSTKPGILELAIKLLTNNEGVLGRIEF